MLEVHEERYDVVGLHDGQQDEDDDQDVMGDGGEGDAYLEDSDEQQDPEGLPDHRTVFRIVVLLNELIMDITGVITVWFIGMLCHCRTIYQLNEVEEGEYKYPDKVYKVPVKAGLFNVFVVPSARVHTCQDIEENNDVDEHPRKDVESVKSGDEEEEIGKERMSVFVSDQVGSVNMFSPGFDVS